jgi:hypothetical protein
MHHATRKKLAAEFSELIASNIEEAKSQMAGNGLTEEEIEEVIAEASKEEGAQAPVKSSKKEASKEEVENGNLPFEKWQMTKRRDENGDVVGLDKVKKVKTVSIRQEQADLLNDQANNTFIQYFPI